jgi:hypothetical protein
LRTKIQDPGDIRPGRIRRLRTVLLLFCLCYGNISRANKSLHAWTMPANWLNLRPSSDGLAVLGRPLHLELHCAKPYGTRSTRSFA